MWTHDFQKRGHRVTADVQDADVVVLNTCAVTGEAAKSSRQRAKRLHRQNPTSKFVLTGCFSELAPEQAEALPGVDLIVSNADKEALVTQVESQLNPIVMPDAATEPAATSLFQAHRTRAFIKIQDGCRNQCTFCIVTVARGEERSRTIDDIVREVQGLADQGFQECVITGVHIGGYGHDINVNLRHLVEALIDQTTMPRIRIGSLEPWNLPDGFFDMWAQSDRLCPHFHLPLQSGCDPVLKRMARRCTVEEFKHLVEQARTAIPNVNITTDLIVGFPGETDDEFQQTTRTILEIGFGDMHIFSYSRRQGTPAARMRNHVPNAMKKARSRIVHNLARGMRKEALQLQLGRSTRVLWETKGESLIDGQPVWLGYTENYFRVEGAINDATIDANRVTAFVPTTIVNGRRLA